MKDTNFHEASVERIDFLGCFVARAKHRSRPDAHEVTVFLVQLDMPTLWSIASGDCETVEVGEACEEWPWYVIQSGPIPVVQQPSDQRYESNRSNGKG